MEIENEIKEEQKTTIESIQHDLESDLKRIDFNSKDDEFLEKESEEVKAVPIENDIPPEILDELIKIEVLLEYSIFEKACPKVSGDEIAKIIEPDQNSREVSGKIYSWLMDKYMPQLLSSPNAPIYMLLVQWGMIKTSHFRAIKAMNGEIEKIKGEE